MRQENNLNKTFLKTTALKIITRIFKLNLVFKHSACQCWLNVTATSVHLDLFFIGFIRFEIRVAIYCADKSVFCHCQATGN